MTRLVIVAPKVFHRNSASGARSGGLPRRKFTLALLLYHSGQLAARMSHRQTRSGGASIAISLRACTEELPGSNRAGHLIAMLAIRGESEASVRGVLQTGNGPGCGAVAAGVHSVDVRMLRRAGQHRHQIVLALVIISTIRDVDRRLLAGRKRLPGEQIRVWVPPRRVGARRIELGHRVARIIRHYHAFRVAADRGANTGDAEE